MKRIVQPSAASSTLPVVACAGCGAREALWRRSQVKPFEDSHEQSCGPDVGVSIDRGWLDLPE